MSMSSHVALRPARPASWPRRFIILTVVVVLLPLTVGHSIAGADPTGTCTWTGGSGSWHVIDNWDCGRVPTAGDEVTIAPAGSVTVDIAQDAVAWSLTLGEDDGGTTHSERHQVRTTVDDVGITVGDGGVTVGQSAVFRLGQREVVGLLALPPLRATLTSGAPVTVHGKLWPGNSTIRADVVLDRPAPGEARGWFQARGWNVVEGNVEVVDGFLQPVVMFNGHFGSPAPYLRVVGGDLTIEAGSGMQLYGEDFPAAAAVEVDGGILRNHGAITTAGPLLGPTVAPSVLDAEFENHGTVDIRRNTPSGLSLRGPAGTEHLNTGTIRVGVDLDGTGAVVNGFGLQVEAGRTLRNLGDVAIMPVRTASGDVSNDGGTVEARATVTGDGPVVLGFAGPQQVIVDLADAGTIEEVAMVWEGSDHPEADLDPRVAGTGHHWDLSTMGGTGSLSLTVPRLTDRSDPQLCRFDPDPSGWACLPTTVATTTLTVADLTTLSAWSQAGTPLGTTPDPQYLTCPPDAAGFDDVAPDSVHAAAVACGAALGLLFGRDETIFEPAGNLTRAQAASILDRLAIETGRPIPGPGTTFPDVASGNVHADAIGRLAAAGVIGGFGDGTFRPNLPITRAQLNSLVIRFVEEQTGETLPLGEPFADVPSRSVHSDTLRKARAAGVFLGDGAGNAAPDLPIRRDQAASLFVRTLPLVPIAADS